MHFRKYDKAINIEGLGLDVNVELQRFLFFFWYDVVWSWQWEVCLVVYSKFLHPYPCDGHHRAFQLDPGLEGDIEEWEGGFHHLRFFDPVVFCFVFFFPVFMPPRSNYSEKKRLLFWLGVNIWPSLKQIRTGSYKNKHISAKSDLVYVSCWNHLSSWNVLSSQLSLWFIELACFFCCRFFFFFFPTAPEYFWVLIDFHFGQ